MPGVSQTRAGFATAARLASANARAFADRARNSDRITGESART